MIFGEISERKRLEREMRDAGRLPPGQSLTLKWPVLHAGSVPRFDPRNGIFASKGLVEQPLRLTWDEFTHLPMKEITADMHCVTRWSRFDVRWEGVPFTEVDEARERPAGSQARDGSCRAGLYGQCSARRSDAPDDDFRVEARRRAASRRPRLSAAPRRAASLCLEKREMGARRGIHGRRRCPGFWEDDGYHIYGDPFKEQRFSTD